MKVNFYNLTKSVGFSLIELLVVISITLVLTGIGTYSISKFNQIHETTEVKEYLFDRLKLARNLSVTNQLPDKSTNLKYVKITVLGNDLTVEAVKNDGTTTSQSPYFSEKLDENGSFSITMTNNSSQVNSFGFSSRDGKLTDADGKLSNGPLIIKISDRLGDYTLTINDLGLIQ